MMLESLWKSKRAYDTMSLEIDRTPNFAIGRANHLLQSEMRNGLQDSKSNLSPEGCSILLLLTKIGEPIRVSELASLAVRDGTTLKRQIDNLVKLEFVTQTKDLSDGRVVLISSTATGNQAIRDLGPLFDSITQKAMDGITPEDLAKTLDVLHKIKLNLLS